MIGEVVSAFPVKDVPVVYGPDPLHKLASREGVDVPELELPSLASPGDCIFAAPYAGTDLHYRIPALSASEEGPEMNGVCPVIAQSRCCSSG